MRRNRLTLMAAGMLVLAFPAGCGSKGSAADQGTGRTVSEIADDGGQDAVSGYDAEEQEGRNDTEPEQPGENKEIRPQTEGDLEEELAAYREERKKGETARGDYVYVQLPNEENYQYGVGADKRGTRLDARELNEAYKAAIDYVEGTLGLDSDVWECADPRMNAIYEDEDKGVADGYDADDLFLCEYEEDGEWHYLIIVREKKGADWRVLYHGDTYKTD